MNIFLLECLCCELETLFELSELKEVQLVWQNVQYVKKAFIMEMVLATLIEDLIKFGNQTSNVLVVK